MFVDKSGKDYSVRFENRFDIVAVIADINNFSVFDTYISRYDAYVFYIRFNVF